MLHTYMYTHTNIYTSLECELNCLHLLFFNALAVLAFIDRIRNLILVPLKKKPRNKEN